MKIGKIQLSLSLVLAIGLLTTVGVSSVSAAKKEKAPKKKGVEIVIPEGDRAVFAQGDVLSTITFPAELTDQEKIETYAVDIPAYMTSIGHNMSQNGTDVNGVSIHYYVHNSKEWLYKGDWTNPEQIRIEAIKEIKFSNRSEYLRDIVKFMPLKTANKETKANQSFQDEINFGSNRYYFFEIVIRDDYRK